ncbi:DUF4126 domain-containing protein [Aliterella atlantica]|uniref:DUF4126 domain-containing protein n=1 Tax=Aliterella atlantica CENA595 TaxID=1618023 RepID=A0A0D8ZSR4_9CYAN|nr:DUF4126 domain-containing protein [Aliterella atlantica]KJH71775.1 hypothetical protein UH38_10290 [Aliterella atlantica CENA595]
MLEVLAALSASAAAGIRIALPLLALELLRGECLWSNVPVLAHISGQVRLAILCSWSLLEIIVSKKLMGQRALQIVQLICSPFAGAFAAIFTLQSIAAPNWIIGLIGGLFAFVLQAVQAGYFYRRRGFPVWFVCGQDVLGVLLAVLAVKQPQVGGIIALGLFLLAVGSYQELSRWYYRKDSR